jgi:signal transduction histidine kinase
MSATDPAPDGAPATPMGAPASAVAGPTGATARPGTVRVILGSPIDPATWRASLAILLGFGVGIVALAILGACFSVGGSLLIWLVGIPIIGLGIEACRYAARAERWRMMLVDHRPLEAHAYRPLPGAPRAPWGAWLRAWGEAEFLDESRWRDVIYVLVVCPLAIFEFALVLGLWLTALALIGVPVILSGLRAGGSFGSVAPAAWTAIVVGSFLVGLVLVPTASLTARGVMILHRSIVEALLCASPAEALRRDVQRLRGSRSAALELEASELRRIERDIHDGAQQHLVALAIDLGRAEERIESDPAAAKALVASAREQARQALTELRDLVRGTAPAILSDRGLVAALAAVAGGCPVPASVDSDLAPGERLPPAVERAAYFVVAESLTNAAKHSGASRCDVRLRREAGELVVEIRDDGAGGATIVAGRGLSGLRDRAEALDGSLSVTSPAGGPTEVVVRLPLTPDGGTVTWSAPLAGGSVAAGPSVVAGGTPTSGVRAGAASPGGSVGSVPAPAASYGQGPGPDAGTGPAGTSPRAARPRRPMPGDPPTVPGPATEPAPGGPADAGAPPAVGPTTGPTEQGPIQRWTPPS